MNEKVAQTPIVDALTHYERLIEEGHDVFYDGKILQEYMARWDGEPFFNALGDLKGKNVLEIGVGTGRIARQILDRGCGHFTGIDISPKTIELAKKNLSSYQNIELIAADCNSFMRERTFDVAYSVLTFMHIEKKKQTLTNVIGSLKIGGCVVLSIDNCGEWFDYGIRKMKLYPASSEDYMNWLQELGCHVKPPVDLIDRFVLPSDEKSETYGKRIAVIIKAIKQ